MSSVSGEERNASSPKTMRPEASHLGSRKRYGCTSYDVSRGSLRSAQSNGVEHRRAAQRCALNGTDQEERYRALTARGSPHKATQGPNCLYSYDAQHAASSNTQQSPRLERDQNQNQLALIASHRRIDIVNREAARQQLCLDCEKGCTKVPELSRRKVSILCISCAPCTFAVQITPVLADSCFALLANSTTVNDFITTAP